MSMNTFSSEDSFDGMEMEVPLNYDCPDFMSSEFFDSVLSLENNMEDGLLSNLDDDVNVSSDASSNTDEVFSPQSLNSESDKNSSYLDNVDDSFLNNVDALDDPFLLSFLESSKLEIKSPQPVIVNKEAKPKMQTKILIQNPNNKKVISKPIITTQARQILKGKPQFLKVNQITGKGTSVILPLNMKSIKILKAPPTITVDLKRNKTNQSEINSNVVSSSNPYPPLMLTPEEKRLLVKEGIQLPTHHPLTKNEERELKRIRRKIRNKISAQDSRKRKKEYVDGLEERVKRGSEENKNLLQRVRALQRQNRTLIAHVNKLQALIKNSTASKATPSTCLMVVLLSALLVSIPNIKLFESKQIATEQEQVAIRRSLLSSPSEEGHLNLEEFLVFKDEDKSKLDEELFDTENNTDAEFNKMIEEMEKEYDGLMSKNNNNSKMGLFGKFFETFKYFVQKENPELFGNTDYGGYIGRKGFLEPDIDEHLPADHDGPPSKRSKHNVEENKGNNKVILTTIPTQMTKDQ